jgi:hypothetical protein
VIIGGAVTALLSATPNAFNSISQQFRTDTHSSSLFVSLFLGCGVAGLQVGWRAQLADPPLADPLHFCIGFVCSLPFSVAW